jgi:Uri superfamily endonuclease
MSNDQVPDEPGSYVLLLELKRLCVIKVGKLGMCRFPMGVYAYIGSALGTGGLRSRVGRHLRGVGKLHWHIDYLRSVAHVANCFYTVSDEPLECVWSQALAALPGATMPAPGFGSSDCRSGCGSHLVRLPLNYDLATVLACLTAQAPSTVISFR